jgi:hypothetical protein
VTTAVREAPHHRNSVCIKHFGCKLPECRARHNARRRAIAAGTLQPSRIFVDAAPVREHLAVLQEAKMTLTGIARLAGVAHTTVCCIVHGRRSSGRGLQHCTTPDIAAKILAIRPLTTVGTLRRIQALSAKGWPTSQVARHAGVSPRRAWEWRPDSTISVDSAEKIAVAYEELRHLTPEENGVEAWQASRARQRAVERRWPDIAYWDAHGGDIDDPHFTPEFGVTRREIVAQNANWVMRTTGLDRHATAERLGVHKSYIDHAFREYPQYALEQAA